MAADGASDRSGNERGARLLQVQPVPVPFAYGARVNAFLVRHPDGDLLVDAGPGPLPDLKGARPRWVTLTHAHFDHAGGLARVKEAYPEARLLLHPDDAASLLRGRVTVPRRIGHLTPLRPLAVRMRRFARVRPVAADGLLDELPAWIQPIETPGHATPHTAFRLEDGDVLAGDVCVCFPPGRPRMNRFVDDPAELRRSLARIAQAATGTVHPAHGMPFDARLLAGILE